MTTLAEELCRPEVVHLVGAFVPSCPSLLVKCTTLAEAFLFVNSRQRCLRTDEEHHQAKLFSFLVKLMLSRWRNIAIYPKRYARAMLQADFEQKQTLTRLKGRIKPYFLRSSCSDDSTTTGGTSQQWSASATEGSTTISYDQADVVNVDDFELLNDRMPPAAHTEDFKSWRNELGLALHENATTTPATRSRYPWRKAWRDELEKLVLVNPPKRRTPADEDGVEASPAEFAGDVQITPISKVPPAIEHMRGDEPVSFWREWYMAPKDKRKPVRTTPPVKGPLATKYGELTREQHAFVAQLKPKRRISDTGTSDAESDESCGHPVRKTPKIKRPLLPDRRSYVQRAYSHARRGALVQKCSPHEVAKICAHARQLATIEWELNQL